MFPCVAKGRRYYEDQDVEVKMVQAAMPGAEICGFFCNGEIGPAPADELGPDDVRPARMMGYSTGAAGRGAEGGTALRGVKVVRWQQPAQHWLPTHLRLATPLAVMCLLKLSPAPPPPPGWHV